MKTSKQNKWMTFIIICLTTGVITELPYLRWALYEPLREFLGQDNTTFGMSASLFGLLSMILYIPGGWIADRFSHKILFTVSAIGCGLLGFWLGTAPSFAMVMVIHALWAVTNIGLFWPTMTKAIALLEDASGQGKVFGFFEGVRGVFVVVMWLGLMKIFEIMGGVAAVINTLSILSIICGVLSFFLYAGQQGRRGHQQREHPQGYGQGRPLPRNLAVRRHHPVRVLGALRLLLHAALL